MFHGSYSLFGSLICLIFYLQWRWLPEFVGTAESTRKSTREKKETNLRIKLLDAFIDDLLQTQTKIWAARVCVCVCVSIQYKAIQGTGKLLS